MARPLKGQQTYAGRGSQCSGQQSHSRIAAGHHERSSRVDLSGFSDCSQTRDSVVRDHPGRCRLGRIEPVHTIHLGGPVEAWLMLREPRPFGLPCWLAAKPEKVLHAALQRLGQGQRGGRRGHQAVGLDRADPARDSPDRRANSSCDQPWRARWSRRWFSSEGVCAMNVSVVASIVSLNPVRYSLGRHDSIDRRQYSSRTNRDLPSTEFMKQTMKHPGTSSLHLDRVAWS